MDQQHVRNVVRALASTSSGNLCTAVPAVVPGDNRRSTYSDCSQFVAILRTATRVDYCNAVRYGVGYISTSHKLSGMPLSCLPPFNISQLRTIQSLVENRSYQSSLTYDILWEHFYFKSVLYKKYLLTYCGAGPKIEWAGAELERSGSGTWKNTVERELSGRSRERDLSGERGLQKKAWAVSGNFDRSRSAHMLWVNSTRVSSWSCVELTEIRARSTYDFMQTRGSSEKQFKPATVERPICKQNDVTSKACTKQHEQL